MATFDGPGEQGDWYGMGAEMASRFDRSYWVEAVERRRFPMEVWRALGAGGRLGVMVPPEYGGRGLGLVELTAMTEGLAAAGFPILSLITSTGLALPAIARAGRPALRDELLPSLCRGEGLVVFAITEAGAGSNIMNLATTAEVGKGHVVLNGTKAYASAADAADHVMVVARTPDPDRDRLGFTVVLVPTDTPGLRMEPAPTRLAIPERQSVLHFDNAEVPLDYVVGEPARGLRVLAAAPVAERVLMAALAVGIGRFCLERGVEHSRQRVLHDRPIGAYQGVQHPLARAHVGLAGAHLLLEEAARSGDRDPGAVATADVACVAATTAGFEAADSALQVMGGLGYTTSGEIHSMHQLARLLRSAPVHTESCLNNIAEQILGLPRSW